MITAITPAEAARIMCEIDWSERDEFQCQLSDDCKDEFARFVRMLDFGPALWKSKWIWMVCKNVASDATHRIIFDRLNGRPQSANVLRMDVYVKAYPTAEAAWHAFFEVVLA